MDNIARFRASLPKPVGLNQSYEVGTGRDGKARFYKSRRAREWAEATVLDLRRQGWGPLPAVEGMYWLSIRYALFTIRQDVDAPAKGLYDCCATVFECNDLMLGHQEGVKIFVKKREHEGLALRVLAVPVLHTGAHRDLSLKILAEDLPLKVLQETTVC